MSVAEHEPRRGLVLGAGAALGGAWALGALCALAEEVGYDPAAADIVLGTSAGSVLAAMIGSGVPLPDMVDRLGGGGRALEGTSPVNPLDVEVSDQVNRALGTLRRPALLPASPLLAARTLIGPHRHTLMTLAAGLAPRGRGDLAPVHELIGTVAAGRSWPVRPRIWIAAMETPSGSRVVFGRHDAPTVSLADAVVASCSAPGYFPPTRIAGRSYVDGGAVSMTNADVLAREQLDEVLVLAPMCMRGRDHGSSLPARAERRLRGYANRRLDAEVRKLWARGISVRVLAPGADDLEAIGAHVMDPRRREAVFETSLRTTRALLLEGGDPPQPDSDARSA